MQLIQAAQTLRDALSAWPQRAPLGSIVWILNPLDYAWGPYEQYLRRYAPEGRKVEAILLGMNPGPWGMAQTGVPFGSPEYVRTFLKLDAPVRAPSLFHPDRPILGLESPRSEVSGQRLWGGIQRCFGQPEPFFARFFVANYCPLAFQTQTGANITPDKLARSDGQALERLCDAHLETLVRTLEPRTVIGVGKWAQEQAARVVQQAKLPVKVATILHPSPASPAANRGWLETARQQLSTLGHPWPEPVFPAL